MVLACHQNQDRMELPTTGFAQTLKAFLPGNPFPFYIAFQAQAWQTRTDSSENTCPPLQLWVRDSNQSQDRAPQAVERAGLIVGLKNNTKQNNLHTVHPCTVRHIPSLPLAGSGVKSFTLIPQAYSCNPTQGTGYSSIMHISSASGVLNFIL